MFPTLTPAQIERLSAQGHVRQIRPGDILVESGEKGAPLLSAPNRLFALLVEQMQVFEVDSQRSRGAHAGLRTPVNTRDVLVAACLHVEEDIAARHFSDLNLALDGQRRNPGRQVAGVVYILRPNADDDAVPAFG